MPITHFNLETKIDRRNSIPTENDPKAVFRRQWMEKAPHGAATDTLSPWGKIAQRLRSVDSYRRSRCVYASLHPALQQARINAVNDQKRLILPTPGLNAGFRLVRPERLRPGDRRDAVSARPTRCFGERLSYESPPRPLIDLVIAESLAVSPAGIRIGDGSGYLDLQIAILGALHWLDPGYQVITLVLEEQIQAALPRSPWDVPVDRIVTERTVRAPRSLPHPPYPILWNRLNSKQIKRNHALFYLQKEGSTRSRIPRP